MSFEISISSVTGYSNMYVIKRGVIKVATAHTFEASKTVHEAFHIVNETGVTLLELKKQRDELLEAAIKLTDAMELEFAKDGTVGVYKKPEFLFKEIDILLKAIKKATI